MAQRPDLQSEFEILMEGGMVKYQPPPGYQLTYPCIIYSQSNGQTRFAGNRPYTFTKKYTVTLISRDPDDPLVEKLAMHFPMFTMDRAFSTEGLHHYVFTLYY